MSCTITCFNLIHHFWKFQNFFLKMYTYPGVVDLLKSVVSNRSQKYDTLYSALPVRGHQFHAHHFSISHQNILEHLVEIIHHKTYMRVGHFFQFSFGVHSSATGRRIHLLGVPLQHLQFFGAGSGAYSKSQSVFKLVDD